MKEKETPNKEIIMVILLMFTTFFVLCTALTIFNIVQESKKPMTITRDIQVLEVTTYDEGAEIVLLVDGQEHLYWTDRAE